MPIQEQTITRETIGGDSAQPPSSEPRMLRVVEIDHLGRIISDTTTVEPRGYSIPKVACHGASMEIPTRDPVATACQIITYLERLA